MSPTPTPARSVTSLQSNRISSSTHRGGSSIQCRPDIAAGPVMENRHFCHQQRHRFRGIGHSGTIAATLATRLGSTSTVSVTICDFTAASPIRHDHGAHRDRHRGRRSESQQRDHHDLDLHGGITNSGTIGSRRSWVGGGYPVRKCQRVRYNFHLPRHRSARSGGTASRRRRGRALRCGNAFSPAVSFWAAPPQGNMAVVVGRAANAASVTFSTFSGGRQQARLGGQYRHRCNDVSTSLGSVGGFSRTAPHHDGVSRNSAAPPAPAAASAIPASSPAAPALRQAGVTLFAAGAGHQ